MSGQTQLIISMIITAGVAGALVYCVVLTRECQKIINKMQRQSKRYIKALDKSIGGK
jgi:archaellum component FlaG (FlaF/FlaG flagellin family)